VSADRAHSRLAIDDFLGRLPRLAVVVGKGGVGKTTVAIGVAGRLAQAGEQTLLVSTDPAGSLGPALGATLTEGKSQRIDGLPELSAMQLDALAARTAFLDRWRETLVTIVDRGTYLDADDIVGLVDASFPGADEIFGLLVLAQLLTPGTSEGGTAWKRIVLDTAPTGHTLRLLALPDTFEAMISLLDTMQAKHRFMVRALTHRYRRDEADEFLDEMRQTLGALRLALGDGTRAGAVLVTRAEPVVVNETVRYAESLGRLGIAIVAIVVEAMRATQKGESAVALEELGRMSPASGLFGLPVVDPPPMGLVPAVETLGELTVLRAADVQGRNSMRAGKKGLRADRESAVKLKSGGAPRARVATETGLGAPSLLPLLRTLTIVGGKGGVGKTTVSCALALSAALDDAPFGDVLLVSTDPAPSIGDALGIDTPRWAHAGTERLDEARRLHVWQMDAAAAFHELRERYRDRIDTLFDSFMGSSVDMVHDRAILRDLLALAPPGVDELYALASLGDALEEKRYSRIIVDPAPTGHLLRLLELPPLAIEWSHRLMRLILKYKEIAGLADAAQELLNFSRRTRALDQLLHDDSRAGVVLVSLDEPLVISETTRLATTLHTAGIAVLGAITNRVREGTREAADDDTSSWTRIAVHPTFVAPEIEGPLIGIAAIRNWCRRWRKRD
jgi:arsenite-transporting ATPase